MTSDLHAPTRRHLLLASGTLFAWAYLPKVARAEGRDPRLLVIVLRGALDGLAAVAPVGDPDWVALRGDKALTLDGKPPALPLDSFLRAQSGDAQPASALQGWGGHHRACDGDVLPRTLALRRPGRAGKRPRQTRRERHRLAQSRARLAAAGRPRRRRTRRLRGRADRAAGGARTGAGAVVDAAAAAAGERRHADAAARPLSAHRSRARARARGAHGARDHRARRRHGRRAAAGGRGRAGACLFRRIRGHRGAVPGAAGRAAHRRARLRRLGHPRRRRRRPTAGSPCCSARSMAPSRRSRRK